MKSFAFQAAKRRSKGRRLTRQLNDKKVMLAQIAAQNPEHQEKFLSRSQRLALGAL
jgi:hypothetical protein